MFRFVTSDARQTLSVKLISLRCRSFTEGEFVGKKFTDARLSYCEDPPLARSAVSGVKGGL